MQWQPIPVELGDDNSLLNEGLFVPCSPDDILTLVIEDDTTVDLGMDEVFADNWFEALVGPDLAEVTDDSSSEESSLLMSLSSLDDISLGFSLDDASEASDLSEEEQDAEPPSTTVDVTIQPSEADRKRWSRTDRDKRALKTWYKRLNEFIQHKQPNGNCEKTKHKSLAIWINKQRNEKKAFDSGKKPKAMYRERIELLEECGFVWAPSKLAVFEKRFKTLSEFHQIVGHCEFPTGNDWYGHDKFERAVRRVSRGMDLSAGEEQKLRRILANRSMPRWISDIREKLQKLDTTQKEKSACTLAEDKQTIWTSRKRRLEDIGFGKSKRHQV